MRIWFYACQLQVPVATQRQTISQNEASKCQMPKCLFISASETGGPDNYQILKVSDYVYCGKKDDDEIDDEIAYFTVRWKTRASFVYRAKNMR